VGEPVARERRARAPVVGVLGCRAKFLELVGPEVLRAKKVEIVDSLHRVFSNAGVVVVTHFQGLSVAEVTELRRGMREVGAKFRVTKNRLAKIALAETSYTPIAELFTGPTAIAYSADPVAAPKAAVSFARKNEKLVIIGGGVDGNLLSADQVRALAELPSLDELRAKLIGLLQTPAARLVGVLQAPGGQIARVLKARAEQG
jgi:large subunit ribosomal protein L10